MGCTACTGSKDHPDAEPPEPARGRNTPPATPQHDRSTPTPKRERQQRVSADWGEDAVARERRRRSTEASASEADHRSTGQSANVADVEHVWKMLQEQALKVGDYEIKWIHIVVVVICLVALCICIKWYRIRRKINEKASDDVASIPDPGSMV